MNHAAVILTILLVGIALIVGVWQLSSLRKSRFVALTTGDEYRALTEEYRRLADMAITAQEHTDLKLADVTSQLSLVREELKSVQRILEDVE